MKRKLMTATGEPVAAVSLQSDCRAPSKHADRQPGQSAGLSKLYFMEQRH